MASLPQSGISLLAQNAAGYIADVNKSAKATTQFAADATAAAAKASKAAEQMGSGGKRAADLWQDAQGRWRTTSGRFASDAEKAAAGVESATKSLPSKSGPHFDRLAQMAKSAFDRMVDSGRGLGNALNEVVVGALRRVGELVTDALAEAGRAMLDFAKTSITSAADVEQTLNVLRVTSGATAAEMEAISKKAIALGGDLDLPATSAQDAAEAMLELSKAGFTAQEAMDAAKGTLQLAAAAETDAGTAAQITANAINAFGLEAKDAAHVADLLAGGANASSASMTDLADGLKQGGFAFDSAGQSIDDLVTSLAALTNVGLTGSDAGTALKNAIVRLQNPTDKAAGLMQSLGFNAYDANGKMKPLELIIHDLNAALAGMTDEQRNAALGTIFLSDGMKAMLPLLDLGDAGFAKLREQVAKTGSAQTVAGAQTQGFNGAIAGLQSQLETFQLVLGTKVLPLLTPFIQQVAAGVSVVGDFATRFLELLPAITSSTDPVNALAIALAVMYPQLTSTIYAVKDMLAPLLNLVSAFMDAGPMSSEFAQALGYLASSLGLPGEAIQRLTTAMQNLISGVLTTIVPAMQPAIAAFTAALPGAITTTITSLTNVLNFVTSLMPTLASIITSGTAIIMGIWKNHGDQILQFIQSTWQMVQGVIQVALGAIQGILAIGAGLITGDWTTFGEQINQSNTLIWQGVRNIIEGFINGVLAFFDTNLDSLISMWQYNLEMLPRIAKAVMDTVLEAFKSALAQAPGIGRSIVDGVKQGVLDAAKGLADAAKAAVRGALAAAKGAILSHSPSKLFAVEVGEPISQGIAKGITDAAPSINTALGDALGDLVDEAAGTKKKKKKSSGGTTAPTVDLAAQAAEAAAKAAAAQKLAFDNLIKGLIAIHHEETVPRRIALGTAYSESRMVSPVAAPKTGSGSSSTDNSRSLTYAPVYNNQPSTNPSMDVAIARSMAAW